MQQRLFSLINLECTIGRAPGTGNLDVKWKLGRASDGDQTYSICRAAFCNAHGITLYGLNRVCSEIKLGVESSEAAFTSQSAVDENVMAEVKEMAKCNKIELTNFDIANMICADTELTIKVLTPSVHTNLLVRNDASILFAFLQCRCWLEIFFKYNGDHNPTTPIISLSFQPKYEIWELYKDEMTAIYKDDKFLKYSSFVHVWDLAFPHVRIHQYKQVRV